MNTRGERPVLVENSKRLHPHSDPLPRRERVWARGATVLLLVLLAGYFSISLVYAGQTGSWNATELQLQNTSPFSKSITATFFNVNGGSGGIIMDTLAAAQTKFYSPTFQVTGTVRVDVSSGVLGVVTHWDASGGAAQWPLIDDVDLTGTAFVPHFAPSLPGSSSRVFFHNPEPLTATVWVTFFGPIGLVTHNRNSQIPTPGREFHDASPLPPSFIGSAVVAADRAIFVKGDRTFDTGFALAQAPSHGVPGIDAPLFMAQLLPDGLDSVLAIQNTGPLSTTGVLTYYHYFTATLQLYTRTFDIPPYAAFEWSADLVAPNSFGHVEASADRPIAGWVLGMSSNPGNPGLWDYTAVAIDSLLPDRFDRRSAYGPTVFDDYDLWSSRVIVANLSSSPAQVTAEFSSAPAGLVTTTEVLIEPHGVSELILPGLPPAYQHASARLEADQAIAAAMLTTAQPGSHPDNFMAYEMPYATRQFTIFLPISLKDA